MSHTEFVVNVTISLVLAAISLIGMIIAISDYVKSCKNVKENSKNLEG